MRPGYSGFEIANVNERARLHVSIWYVTGIKDYPVNVARPDSIGNGIPGCPRNQRASDFSKKTFVSVRVISKRKSHSREAELAGGDHILCPGRRHLNESAKFNQGKQTFLPSAMRLLGFNDSQVAARFCGLEEAGPMIEALTSDSSRPSC